MLFESDAPWRRRFTAPSIGFPVWSARRPDDLFFVSNEGGVKQVWYIDHRSGERRQVTEQRIGVEDFVLTPDGTGVVWWSDETGNESGEWVLTSLGDASTVALLPDLPSG